MENGHTNPRNIIINSLDFINTPYYNGAVRSGAGYQLLGAQAGCLPPPRLIQRDDRQYGKPLIDLI